MRITLLRTPLQVKFGGKKPYDWTATVEALNGGVIVTNEDFMYVAPQDGYKPQFQIKMLASSPNWTPSEKVSLYFKSRGGQCYGRLNLEFYTDSPKTTTGFSIQSVVNPDRSQSLE